MKTRTIIALTLLLAGCQNRPAMEIPQFTRETIQTIPVSAVCQGPIAASENRIVRVGKTLEVLAADLGNPLGVTLDPQGRTVFSDASRQRVYRIENGRRVTLAGTGTSFYPIGDESLAVSAQLSAPHGVAYGPEGSLYIADTDNNRIRKVDKDGIITTVVGSGTLGFDGDGGDPKSAKLNHPQGVAFGSDGTMYVADTGNHRIRRVKNNTISTVAGNGEEGFSGDKGDAAKAQLASPSAVVAEGESFYLADSGNGKIRWVDSYGRIATVSDGYQKPTLGGGSPLLVGDQKGLYRLMRTSPQPTSSSPAS